MQISGFNCPANVPQSDVEKLTRMWNAIDEIATREFGLSLMVESVLISTFAYCIVVRNDGSQSNHKAANLLRRAVYESRWGGNVWDEIPDCPGRLGIETSRVGEKPLSIQDLKAQVQLSQYALPVILGESSFGKPVVIDIADFMFLSIMGSDTYEQGEQIPCFFQELASTHGPQEWQYACITGCGILWSYALPKQNMWENGIVQLASNGTVDIPSRQNNYKVILGNLQKEMETRQRLFDAFGVETIAEYNSRAKHPLPHILAFAIDVNGDAANSFYESYFEQMSPENQRTGLHLILIDDYPKVDVNWGPYCGNWNSVLNSAYGHCGVDGNVGRITIPRQFDPNKSTIAIGGLEAMHCGDKMLYRSPYGELFRIQPPASVA